MPMQASLLDFPSTGREEIEATVSKKDLAATPTPEHITLLLKNHKETVLLSVKPDTPFSEVKSLLLAVLRDRGITSIQHMPISDKPEDVEFGMLHNKKNPAEGWVLLDTAGMEVGDAKSGKRSAGGKKKILNESPAGASLGDGSMLAFRFRTKQEEHDPEDEDDEMEIEDDPGWNVVLPSYDDED